MTLDGVLPAILVHCALASMLAGESKTAGCPVEAQPAGRMNLVEVLRLAEQHNPRLKAAEAGVRTAGAAILSAKAYLNPTLTVGSLGRQRAIVEGAVPGMLHGLAVNQPIELPMVRRSRISAAEMGSQSSRFALAETRLAVRGAVKQVFFEVMRRNAELGIARDNLQLLEDLRRRIEVQVRVGEAAKLELTRADAEVAAARIQVQSAELRRAAALSSLDAAVGKRLDTADFEAPLASPATLPPLERIREQVLGAHPAIAVAEAETRRAAAWLDHQRALRIPQPSVWADVFRQPDVSQYRYGVVLDLPLWNRRRGPIAEAAGVQQQAQAMAEQRRLEIGASLERAYSLYQVASQQVRMFETGTVRVAEAAVHAAEAAFRFGERSIIEVLDARRVLRAARLDYLNAQFDRQQALLELEQLGVLTGKDGQP